MLRAALAICAEAGAGWHYEYVRFIDVQTVDKPKTLCLMSSSFRVIGVNLIVLVFLVVSIRLLNRYDEFGYALITAMAIATQLLTNLLFAILHDNSDARLAHLLSISLLLLIGFGACVGGAAIRF